MSTPASDPSRPTALVFAGGGSLGAVQVGMLKALFEKNGVTADFVVGASVGALNAAYFAGDPTLKGGSCGSNKSGAPCGAARFFRSPR